MKWLLGAVPRLYLLNFNYWCVDLLPATCGALAPRNVNLTVTKVTMNTCTHQLPLGFPMPTVTVTETVGVLATPVVDVYAAPYTAPSSPHVSARPRSSIASYDYLEPLDGQTNFAAAPLSFAFRLSSFGDWLVHEQYSMLHILACLSLVLAVFCGPFGRLWLAHSRAMHIARQTSYSKVADTLIGKLLDIWACLPFVARAVYEVLLAAGLWAYRQRLIEIQDSFEVLGMLATRAVRLFPRRSTTIVRILFAIEDRCEPIGVLLLHAFRSILVACGTKVTRIYHHGRYQCNGRNSPCAKEEDIACQLVSARYHLITEDYQVASTLRYSDIVHMVANERTLEVARIDDQEQIKLLSKEIAVFELNAKELGEKTMRLTDSLIAMTEDRNWMVTLLGNILNYVYNVNLERHPNGPDSRYPFLPQQYQVTPVPDPKTGLFYVVRQTVDERMSYKSRFMGLVKDKVFNSREAPKVLPRFIESLANGSFIPKICPFEENGWMLRSIFPDLILPPWKGVANPMNPKRVKKETRFRFDGCFGVQIENLAAAGKLVQWPPKKPMNSYEIRFPKESSRLFKKKLSLFPTTPAPQINYPDPCPTGSPMDTSPVRY
ncbi:hypothetical protein ACN47E_000376 [Coniothyrium glycines]